ncbi:MAG: ribbon-helix-helix protein, CopG family [Chloroflexota bacterium]
MKRTTVLLPDDLAALLDLERRRRDVSTAEVIRDALEVYLKGKGEDAKPFSFIGAGRSGRGDVARNIEEILAREWGGDDLAGSRRLLPEA